MPQAHALTGARATRDGTVRFVGAIPPPRRGRLPSLRTAPTRRPTSVDERLIRLPPHALDHADRLAAARAALRDHDLDAAALSDTMTLRPASMPGPGVENLFTDNVMTSVGRDIAYWHLASPPPDTTDALPSIIVEYWLDAVPGKALLFDVEVLGVALEEGCSSVEVNLRSFTDAGGLVAEVTPGSPSLAWTALPQSWGDGGLTYAVLEVLPRSATSGGSISITALSITGLS